MSNVKNSGDGTRPSTDGGVDNMGAGEKFTTEKTAAGEDISAPAPRERMQDKQANAQGTRHDDSAPFHLTEDLTPASSTDKNRR
jgi:hypothetical protein